MTIMVSIASYCDPDLQNTIDSLLTNATHPDQLRIVVCQQFAPDEAPIDVHPQVVLDYMTAADSLGCCWARNRIMQRYQGEDFFLQIDAHMRFVPDWDTKLLEMHAQCPGPRSILSTYPLEMDAADHIIEIKPNRFDPDGFLVNEGVQLCMADAPKVPASGPYISAALLFMPGELVTRCPYDPYLYFAGEEVMYAVRLWTHGWNIFFPNQVIARHDYKRHTAKRHWTDRQGWGDLDRRAKARIRYLLGISDGLDAQYLTEIDKYGLGTARTLQQYEALTGISFASRTRFGQPLGTNSAARIAEILETAARDLRGIK